MALVFKHSVNEVRDVHGSVCLFNFGPFLHDCVFEFNFQFIFSKLDYVSFIVVSHIVMEDVVERYLITFRVQKFQLDVVLDLFQRLAF